jgi:hypothetical protein
VRGRHTRPRLHHGREEYLYARLVVAAGVVLVIVGVAQRVALTVRGKR